MVVHDGRPADSSPVLFDQPLERRAVLCADQSLDRFAVGVGDLCRDTACPQLLGQPLVGVDDVLEVTRSVDRNRFGRCRRGGGTIVCTQLAAVLEALLEFSFLLLADLLSFLVE